MARWVPSPGSASPSSSSRSSAGRRWPASAGSRRTASCARSSGSSTRAIAETTRLIDGIEPRVAKATATAQRLEEARARLEESAATARVLFAAFGEALALVRRVSAFVPR